MKTKFYLQQQNNSGGYWFQDDNVDVFVFVEAKTVKQAIKKFKKICAPYMEYCECCGYRWDFEYLGEHNGKDEPMIFGENYKEFNNPFWCTNGKAIIYYLDGTKEIYDLSQNLPKSRRVE